MPGRSFSLGKYSEQGEGSQKLSNPPPRQGAVLPFHSSCPVSTVTQSDRKAQEARFPQQSKDNTTAHIVLSAGTCSRLLLHIILHHGLFAIQILHPWVKFEPRKKHCKSESLEILVLLFCIQLLFENRRWWLICDFKKKIIGGEEKKTQQILLHLQLKLL